MRKAAISWEKNYAEKLAAVGFKLSRAAPTTFYNPVTKVRQVVHGDDFTFSGTQVELEKIRGLFKKWYDVKDRGIMGSGTRDIKEVVILGRTLKFTEMGLEYTADCKHRDAILEELGLESESKSLGCPALGTDKMDEAGDEYEFLKEDVTSFRSVAARSNYLGMDRSDIQYGVKELCATMSRPTQRSWRQLKQLGRYLVGKADMTWEYKAGALTDMIDVYVAAAQEHIRRPGDRGRDSGQELVTYSTWLESQFCRGGVLCHRDGCGRGARGASVGEKDGLEDVCLCSHGLVCRQGGGVSTWFGKAATHRVEVLMGPRIGTRTEDGDQEDQWTRQPRRLSGQAKGLQVLRTLAESFRSKMEVIDYPKG